MKLLSILTVCAALCIAVTQASPQLQEGETDAASFDELLDMLAEEEGMDEAEGMDETEGKDSDVQTASNERSISSMLSNKRKAKSQHLSCNCHCGRKRCWK